MSPSAVERIERIRVLIDERLQDDGIPSLGELAAAVAMSRSHLSRTFHALAGVSLRSYVRDARLQRAAAMLISSTLPVTFVAVECGFYDLPHLDKGFRRRFGMTPHQFRRHHGVAADRHDKDL
jgi:xylan 1,4-beta-xylosidase